MMLRGWANLPHALRTGQGALDDALGVEFYAHLQQHPAEAAVFDAAMSSVSRQESAALDSAVKKGVAAANGARLSTSSAGQAARQGSQAPDPALRSGVDHAQTGA